VTNVLQNCRNSDRLCFPIFIDTALERDYFGKRYGITQALGWDGIETIHIDQLKLEPGDCVLLCTDGIHDNLTDQEIEEVLRGGAPKTAAKWLVQRAQQLAR
jgi:PPM family protein phosphatase